MASGRSEFLSSTSVPVCIPTCSLSHRRIRRSKTMGSLWILQLQKRFDVTLIGFMNLVEASKHYPCAKKAWVEYLGEHPEPILDRVE